MKKHAWKLSKYGILGVVAVAVRVGMFYFFSRWWPSDKSIPGLSDFARAENHFLANACAFLFSNLTAYAGNALWVFEGGRHRRSVEFFYFTLVSIIGWAIGSICGPGMIAVFGISSNLGLVNMIVASLVVNYWGRRHLVFLR